MLFRCLLVGLILHSGSCGGKKPARVQELTQTSFEKTLQKHERTLVELYAPCLTGHNGDKAPWCEDCKKMETTLQEVADLLRQRKLSTKVAKVDVKEQEKLAKRFKFNFEPQQEDEIPKLPTLHYYVRGKRWSSYHGPTTADKIVDWLAHRELQAVSMIEESEVDAYVNGTEEGGFALVARVKAKSPRSKVFWSAVEDGFLGAVAGPFRFRLASAPLPASADANRDSSLTLYRPSFPASEPKMVKYSGKWHELDIVKWAKKKAYPSISLTYDAEMYSSGLLSQVGYDASVVAVTSGEREGLVAQAEMVELLRPLAKKFSSWRFVCAELSSLDVAALATLGLINDTTPVISVIVERRRHLMPEQKVPLSTKSVGRFLYEVKARTVQPTFRSALAPERAVDEHGIVTLTGDTFEEQVFDASRDVLVFFHAPGCERCREEVGPMLEALAGRASSNGWSDLGLVIARMDVSENDCREDVPTLPKLVLYPAVARDRKMEMRVSYPQKYKLELLVAFLREYARSLKGARNEL